MCEVLLHPSLMFRGETIALASTYLTTPNSAVGYATISATSASACAASSAASPFSEPSAEARGGRNQRV